ncbi:MAG: NAD(P)-dependent oxidoreductase, partial [Clostridium perfringens]
SKEFKNALLEKREYEYLRNLLGEELANSLTLGLK